MTNDKNELVTKQEDKYVEIINQTGVENLYEKISKTRGRRATISFRKISNFSCFLKFSHISSVIFSRRELFFHESNNLVFIEFNNIILYLNFF